MQVEVQRAAGRFESRGPGVASRHSFSFGRHYDPSNVSFGLLLAVNEERLAAGAGFGPHPHAGVEIVTWVLDGELHHTDSAGGTGAVWPGMVQRLYTGEGVTHCEYAAPDGPVRLVQMWLATGLPAGPPEYEVRQITPPLPAGRPLPAGPLLPANPPLHPGPLWPVAAPGGGVPAALRLRQRAAALYAARLESGEAVVLLPALFLHVQVVAGRVRIVGRDLAEMDTVRVTDAGPLTARAGPGGGQLLVWCMRSDVQPGC